MHPIWFQDSILKMLSSNLLSFLWLSFFFLNLTFKTQGQSHSSRSHSRYNIVSTGIPFISCWKALPFLGYSYFKNCLWKSKVMVMGEVKVQSHNVSLTSQGCTKWWTRRTSPPQADFDRAKKWFQNQAEQTFSPARLIKNSNNTYLIILNMNYNPYL